MRWEIGARRRNPFCESIRQARSHPPNPMKTPSFHFLAEWFLRVALAFAFLSAVADRFGLWGAPGLPGVAWGDWPHFMAYFDRLNPWLPAVLRPGAAWGAKPARGRAGRGRFCGTGGPRDARAVPPKGDLKQIAWLGWRDAAGTNNLCAEIYEPVRHQGRMRLPQWARGPPAHRPHRSPSAAVLVFSRVGPPSTRQPSAERRDVPAGVPRVGGGGARARGAGVSQVERACAGVGLLGCQLAHLAQSPKLFAVTPSPGR